MTNEFLTWVGLLTVAGATAAVLLITQYIKPLFPNFNTRWLVLLLAVLITQVASFVTGSTWQDHLLMLLNAFVVAAAAMGTYEVTFKVVETKKAETSGGNT